MTADDFCLEIDGHAVHLEADDYKDEPDIFVECQEMDISEEDVSETADIVHDIDPDLNMWIALFQEVNI